MSEKKRSSLKRIVSGNYLALIIVFSLALLDGIAFIIIEVLFRDQVSPYIPLALGGVLILLFVALLVLYIAFSERTYRLFYEKLYKQNKNNVEAIYKNQTELMDFDNAGVKEFAEMNSLYNDLSKQVKGRTIISPVGDYSRVSLKYIDKDRGVVTYDSLVNNIHNLIIITQSFRNALIDFSYDLGDDLLNEDDKNKVIDEICSFLNYPNLLIAEKNDHLGFIVYVPTFDNVPQINEELTDLIRHISLIKQTSVGKRVSAAHISLVAYPYSDADHMLEDLDVARRSESAINIYLPKRETKLNKEMLLHSRNINVIAKLHEEISALDPDPTNVETSMEEMKAAIKEIANYFDFSNAGLISYNKINKSYTCTFSFASEGEQIIIQDKKVPNKLIENLNLNKDVDNSYYFATRKHINGGLAPYMDSNEISSGLFYMINKGNECLGSIFFINKGKDIEFTSYLRDSLISFANKMATFLKSIDDREVSIVSQQKFDDILKISNEYLYSVNPENYDLIYMSDALKDCAPKAELNQPCYKTIYGLDEPCKGCPLKAKKNMIGILQRKKFETSIILRNKDDKAAHLRLLPADNKVKTRDRFDTDFLVNSFYSFIENLEQLFDASEGEVLYLSIDNAEKIVKRLGNDGYIRAMRKFFDLIEEQLDRKVNIYAYKNDCFAIILPLSSRQDVLEFEEGLFEISKKITIGGKKADLIITYFDFLYPNGVATVKEYIAHNEKVMTGYRRGKKEDFIYFPNDNFTRPASRELYMLSNIEESFKQNKYKIQYQPVVANKDRLVHSMELLLRVNDPHNDLPLNIAEVINIAFKNHRVDLISGALVDCINNLYTKYGYTFFKSVGLDHLSINADYTYFKDGGLAEKLVETSVKNNVPKDFLLLELGEDELNDHYDTFKALANKLPAQLVCDRYTGKYLSVAQLSELGVSHVKVDRQLVMKIAEDIDALGKCRQILQDAHKFNIALTYIGVEKREETDLLHDDLIDFYMQGYYFYKPMDEEKAFKELRESTMSELNNLDS